MCTVFGMTTPQNSRVPGETRELLSALRDLLDGPGSEHPDKQYRRVGIALGHLDALLNVEGVTLPVAAEELRKRTAELNPAADR